MNYERWKQITDEGYNSDVVSFLFFLKEGEQLDLEHPKTKSILALMKRKKLIDEELNIISEEIVGEKPPEDIPEKKDKFEEWWGVYPSTNSFIQGGRAFPGIQSKKIKRDKSKEEFNKAVKEGISANSIIEATRYHILQAKDISVKKNENQLSFIANSERYLRERMYLPYINLVKEEEPVYKSNIL